MIREKNNKVKKISMMCLFSILFLVMSVFFHRKCRDCTRIGKKVFRPRYGCRGDGQRMQKAASCSGDIQILRKSEKILNLQKDMIKNIH